MIRKIIQIGDPRLNMVSKPVNFPMSNEDKELASDLLETAKSVGDKGAGISAAQVGVNKRIAICRRVDIEELILRMNSKTYLNSDFVKSPDKYVVKLIENDELILSKDVENICNKIGLTKGTLKLTKIQLKKLFDSIDKFLWLTIINPEVLFENDYETMYWEGCLSVGVGKTALYAPVARTEIIEYRYMDVTGKQHTMKTAEYFAHVVLHEIDHMDGILFLSKVENIENIWKANELDEYIKVHNKYPEIK